MQNRQHHVINLCSSLYEASVIHGFLMLPVVVHTHLNIQKPMFIS